MTGDRGTYALVFELMSEVATPLGTLEGPYCYIGSAFGPGGLEARIRRHLKRRKPIKWHIDYLTSSAGFRFLCAFSHPGRVECDTAQALSLVLEGEPRFGCSDCRCRSHLFGLGDLPSSVLADLLRDHGFREFPIKVAATGAED